MLSVKKQVHGIQSSKECLTMDCHLDTMYHRQRDGWSDIVPPQQSIMHMHCTVTNHDCHVPHLIPIFMSTTYYWRRPYHLVFHKLWQF